MIRVTGLVLGLLIGVLLPMALGCHAVGRGLRAAAGSDRRASSAPAIEETGDSICRPDAPQVRPPGCRHARRECICEGRYRGCRWAWVGCSY
jgi:hypothetical protein